jgi:hypothetical protein
MMQSSTIGCTLNSNPSSHLLSDRSCIGPMKWASHRVPLSLTSRCLVDHWCSCTDHGSRMLLHRRSFSGISWSNYSCRDKLSFLSSGHLISSYDWTERMIMTSCCHCSFERQPCQSCDRLVWSNTPTPTTHTHLFWNIEIQPNAATTVCCGGLVLGPILVLPATSTSSNWEQTL